MALPDFFIAGAPKAGTSALHRALSRHPALFLSPGVHIARLERATGDSYSDWLADHGRGAFPARAANPTP